MIKKRLAVPILFITLGLLFSACESNKNSIDKSKPLTVEDAKALIAASDEHYTQSFKLIDITSDDLWNQTKHQLFKIVDGSNCETFVVTKDKAVRIGEGFGGFGVTSAVPFDVNKDGKMDIVYAYSFGSGIHRSLISWIDLEAYKSFLVDAKPEMTDFRTEDLILKVEGKKINVYRITEASDFDIRILFAYPTDEDIASMALAKDGELRWENNALVEIR